jgi:short-subunit dehydrogenase
MPVPFMASYSASKAFVRSFSESLAEELSGTGVRVTVLCPGHVPSGFQAAAGFEEGAVHPPGALSAEETARLALRGYVRGERVVVTGLVNQLGAVAVTALPNRIVTRVGAKMMRKFGRFA